MEPFPNPKSIKRPPYLDILDPLDTPEKIEQWNNDVLTRYKMLTTDSSINGRKRTNPYQRAKNGLHRRRIPQSDWENIVDHVLWVSCYTYDRDKIENIQKYNEWLAENKPDAKPRKVPKSVCPLPNYFWKLLYFTSGTWYKKYSHQLVDCTSLNQIHWI